VLAIRGMDFLCSYLLLLLLRLVLLYELMHSINMWITHFFLGCYASDVTLANTFISAPEIAKEKLVLSAVQYFALFVAQLQASVEMMKSVLI